MEKNPHYSYKPPDFIQGFEGNALARIKCRSFERLCNGTCYNCRREREEAKKELLEKWRSYFHMRRSYPERYPQHIGDPENPETMTDHQIASIDRRKIEIWNNYYQPRLIHKTVGERTQAIIH